MARLDDISLGSRTAVTEDDHLVVVKQLRGLALRVGVHDFKQLSGQLEGCGLKVDAPRGVAEHEAKVDVDDVASLIQHDIAIVPVLDLHEEAHKAVACHALYKVPLSFQACSSALHSSQPYQCQLATTSLSLDY